jgi:hypothetical protein
VFIKHEFAKIGIEKRGWMASCVVFAGVSLFVILKVACDLKDDDLWEVVDDNGDGQRPSAVGEESEIGGGFS